MDQNDLQRTLASLASALPRTEVLKLLESILEPTDPVIPPLPHQQSSLFPVLASLTVPRYSAVQKQQLQAPQTQNWAGAPIKEEFLPDCEAPATVATKFFAMNATQEVLDLRAPLDAFQQPALLDLADVEKLLMDGDTHSNQNATSASPSRHVVQDASEASSSAPCVQDHTSTPTSNFGPKKFISCPSDTGSKVDQSTWFLSTTEPRKRRKVMKSSSAPLALHCTLDLEKGLSRTGCYNAMAQSRTTVSATVTQVHEHQLSLQQKLQGAVNSLKGKLKESQVTAEKLQSNFLFQGGPSTSETPEWPRQPLQLQPLVLQNPNPSPMSTPRSLELGPLSMRLAGIIDDIGNKKRERIQSEVLSSVSWGFGAKRTSSSH